MNGPRSRRGVVKNRPNEVSRKDIQRGGLAERIIEAAEGSIISRQLKLNV